MTIYEKLILESLHTKPKNIMELELHLGLDTQIILNCLNRLIENKMINEKKSLYYCNLELGEIKKTLPSDLSGIIESSTKSCLENSDKKEGLYFNRVWLDKSEQKIFDALLYQVRSFLDNVKKEQKKGHYYSKLKDQKLFFYCKSSIDDLLKQSIAEL